MSLKSLNRPLSRRQVLATFAALFGAPASVGVYANLVGRYRLTVEEVAVAIPGLPGEMRAVQISDLHMRGPSSYMDRVAGIVNGLQADFLFLTGDLVENKKHLPECLDWIARLERRQGAFFVPGNWDHWSETWENGLEAALAKIGVESLFNTGRTVAHGGGRFYLAGVDDVFYGIADPPRAMAAYEQGLASIVLSHAPVGIRSFDRYRVDLMLAGHTHGGQIRLPFVGAIKTPPGSGPYVEGLYEYGAEKRLYVNRGIGTAIIPVRLNCPAEITHLTLRPA